MTRYEVTVSMVLGSGAELSYTLTEQAEDPMTATLSVLEKANEVKPEESPEGLYINTVEM